MTAAECVSNNMVISPLFYSPQWALVLQKQATCYFCSIPLLIQPSLQMTQSHTHSNSQGERLRADAGMGFKWKLCFECHLYYSFVSYHNDTLQLSSVQKTSSLQEGMASCDCVCAVFHKNPLCSIGDVISHYYYPRKASVYSIMAICRPVFNWICVAQGRIFNG